MSFRPALAPGTATCEWTPAVGTLIEARTRDVGGLPVRRLLPFRGGRGVGPFVFFDHMGPRAFAAGEGVDVLPHPHIGLATVTYLFEGSLVHRDSLGSTQAIRPREVNWMIAGQGIAHSERTDPETRRMPSRLHGLQLWVALPRDAEEMPPIFQHVGADSVPSVEARGARIRVLAGRAYGADSPVRTPVPLFYADVELAAGGEISVPDEYPERAAYIAEGTIACDGRDLAPGRMLLFAAGRGASLSAKTAARLVLLGGPALDGPRHIWWNFVSSSPERLEQAKRDWKAGRFARVVGDEAEFTPLPER